MTEQSKKLIDEKIGYVLGLRRHFLPAIQELDLTDRQVNVFFSRVQGERAKLWIKISEWLAANKIKMSKDGVKRYIKKILKISDS